MIHQLHYGGSSNLELELPAYAQVYDFRSSSPQSITDPAAAVQAALRHPIAFPPINDLIVPGDQIVVALDPAVPATAQLAAGIVSTLLDCGAEPDHITLLLAADQQLDAAWRAQLPDECKHVQVEYHDPDNRQKLAYLAAAKDASPILLSRLLCDADVVLPVNLIRPENALLYAGPHGGLYPNFADAQTQKKYRTPNSAATQKQQHLRQEEAKEVAWLLGIQLSIQVVAGQANTLSHVLAGIDEEVSREAQAIAERTWNLELPQRTGLVVATIECDAAHCSWIDVARALHTAQQACLTDGIVVLCCDLAQTPEAALRRLAGHDDKERLLQRIGNAHSVDAVAAWLLAEAQDRNHVCMISQLDEQTIESLGVGFIESPDQLQRLAHDCQSCALIRNAHQAVVKILE